MNEKFVELENRAKNRAGFLLSAKASKEGRLSKDITEEERQSMFKEVFATLIVQEVLEIIEEEGSNEGGSVRSINKIKEIFGV